MVAWRAGLSHSIAATGWSRATFFAASPRAPQQMNDQRAIDAGSASRIGWSVLRIIASGSNSVRPSGPDPSRPEVGSTSRSSWIPAPYWTQALKT